MKSRILFIMIILMACGFIAVQAQDTGSQSVKTADPASQEQLLLPGDPSDPKIPAEQRELIQNAGVNNPSKPLIKPDPRSEDYGKDPEKSSGASNAKPAGGLTDNPMKEEEERSARLKQDQSLTNTAITNKQPVIQEQPEGQKPKTVTNFRKANGSNDQPASPDKGKAVNYREMNRPNEQPKGTAPGK